MYYVYILRLKDQTCYIGFSSDLKLRVKAHEQGLVSHTRNMEPKLVFYCAFNSKRKAISLEKYLKSSSGFAFRNKHLV